MLPGHPAVAQCPVFGSRDGESVEPMHTAVVPAAGQRPTLDGIRDSVTTREGRPCAPDALRLVPAIPLTAAGRPDKRLPRSWLPRSRLSD
ncbi:hypothetical protein [Streptomyces sp. NPDC018347]|uniref:AMP-binding enzyme n=1 Tax=Streptomyces sp. NPDC018347 TaxID=3157193 RepID=UPI00340E5F2B